MNIKYVYAYSSHRAWTVTNVNYFFYSIRGRIPGDKVAPSPIEGGSAGGYNPAPSTAVLPPFQAPFKAVVTEPFKAVTAPFKQWVQRTAPFPGKNE